MNKIHLIQFQSRKGVALEYRKLNNRVKLLGEKIGKSTLNWTMKIKNQVTAKAIKGNRKFLWWFWSIQRPLDHQSPAVKKPWDRPQTDEYGYQKSLTSVSRFLYKQMPDHGIDAMSFPWLYCISWQTQTSWFLTSFFSKRFVSGLTDLRLRLND